MTPISSVRAVLGGVIGAIIGGILLLFALHLWQDHRALHALIDLVNQQAAQQRQQPQQPSQQVK